MKESNIKTAIVGVLISVVISCFMITTLVVFDHFLHKKFDKRGGLNYRGYRGDVVGRKGKDEIRIGLFGGSVAMGYGVENEKSIVGFLQKFMDEKSRQENLRKKYSVINLAATKESSSAYFKSSYMHFSYLDLDAVILYIWEESPNNKIIQISYSERTGNWVFRNFNYYFIFPTVLREKYYLLRYGDISKGYRENNFFDRIVTLAVDGNAGNYSNRPQKVGNFGTLNEFSEELTDKGKTLIFALSPSAGHDDPHSWLAIKEKIKHAFTGNSKIILADLEDAFSGDNPSSYLADGLHYNENGNRAIAKALLPYIPYHLCEK